MDYINYKMDDKKPEIRFKISEVLNKKLNDYCELEGVDRNDIIKCAFFDKLIELGILTKHKKEF